MISWCESRIYSSDKTHHRQTRGFTQGYLHFFFRRGSYKSSYSLKNFLLEGEVNILNKTVQLPNAFMCKAIQLGTRKIFKLPANLWSGEDILNWLYNYLKDLIICTHTRTRLFWFCIRRSRYNYGDDDTLASEWHIWIIILAPHPHPPKSIFRYGYPLVKKKTWITGCFLCITGDLRRWRKKKY